MKKKKMLLAVLAIAGITVGGLVYAADHIDSPTVTNQSTDITDLYVFRGQDVNNLVFVANTQGLLAPSRSLEKKTLLPIPGTVPQLTALPPGCAADGVHGGCPGAA